MRVEALRQSHGNVELAICRLFSGHSDDAQQVIDIDGDDSGGGSGGGGGLVKHGETITE